MSATELAAALVRAESVNPSLDPAGSGEAPAVRVVEEWASSQGLRVEVDELSTAARTCSCAAVGAVAAR